MIPNLALIVATFAILRLWWCIWESNPPEKPGGGTYFLIVMTLIGMVYIGWLAWEIVELAATTGGQLGSQPGY